MSFLNYLLFHRKLGIKRNELVVEIGSGGDPFLRPDKIQLKKVLIRIWIVIEVVSFHTCQFI